MTRVTVFMKMQLPKDIVLTRLHDGIVSWKPYGAIRFSILILFSILLATPAGAVSFDFGISPSMTVFANQPSFIPAAIINTANTPLNFGCASASCGGLSVGAAVGAGRFPEGLNALNFQFGSGSPESLLSQFSGRTLAPNETFNFTFGTVNFNPSESIGNPFGTVLHPTFSFDIDQVSASIPTTISVGEQVSFSPFSFVAATATTSAPEPSTFLLFACGLAMLVGWSSLRIVP